MIERYQRPGMAALWSLECQYRTWLDIEILACEAWAQLGKIPAADLTAIRERADFSAEEVAQKELETKHDVAAFVSVVQQRVGPAGRYIHLGLTSSDIVDTAFSCRMTRSADVLLEGLDRLLEITQKRALQDKKVPVMGRTHGIHAEPTSFGAKWLLWHDVLRRTRSRIVVAREQVAVGKLSGAVGNYAQIPPEIERYVCEKLGLAVDTLSTQVIARDRFAHYFTSIALLGSAVEMIATEIRHLQRSEVGEVREGFTRGQKGSSAMPHKRNPISSENLCGLARLLRSMAIPALENCALWHERDISHSSVERVIAPDANLLADFVLNRLGDVLECLEVFPDQMKKNLDLLHGVVYSQRVLIALVEKGLSRDEAYALVQKHALHALDTQTPFLAALQSDPQVTQRLPAEALSEIFDLAPYFKHVDYLYQKVLG